MPTKKGAGKKGASKTGASKKGTSRKGTKKGTSKRELIDTGTDKRYVRRDERGRFDESDDMGRSLAADRRRPAKTKVPKGQGDKGDQKR